MSKVNWKSPVLGFEGSKKISTSSKSIVNWYKGRTILVTGGTGFMGKVLLEKLLWSCSDIERIYVVVRPKRGMASKTRIQEMVQSPLFQRLREKNGDILKKLVAVEGDATVENLGLSEENQKRIKEEVSVVFHFAATLKLEAELKESVQHNLFGIEYVLKLAKGIKNLKVFVHLSTAFCHCDVDVLEERVYPPLVDPKKVMNICEWMDEKSLNLITPSLIAPHPNTYTFTKRLSETVVHEYGKTMPVVIMRPSIVLPTLEEPFPGWVDSLNGPVGVLIGAGKGVIRSMLVEANNHAEAIPVDIAINGIIIAAWHRATTTTTNSTIHTTTPVYNVTQSDVHPITWGQVLAKGRRIFQENPFDWPLWYPDGDIRTNVFVHNILVFFFQLLPAYFVDLIFALTMQKRFMVRIQKRIKLGMHLLQYFTLREWKFKNHEFLRIVENLPEDRDTEIFYTTNVDRNVDVYLKNVILGARLYCLKETPDNIPFAKRYLLFLYILDRSCKIFIFFGFFWMILSLSDRVHTFHEHYYHLIKNV